MGTRVVAMGFPLGQNTMKLAMGEIAGNQEVGNFLLLGITFAMGDNKLVYQNIRKRR